MKYLFIIIIITVNIYSQSRLYSLDTITVKTTKNEDINQLLYPSQKNIREDETFRTTKKSLLSYASERITGLFVTETSGFGYGLMNGGGKTSIRGVSGSQQVVSIFNGSPDNSNIFGHNFPDLNYLNVNSDAGFIKGPASLQYGSGAMGGAILISRRKSFENGFNSYAAIEYGSFNSLNTKATTEFGFSDIGFYTDFNYKKTDGYRNNSAFSNLGGSFGGRFRFDNLTFDLDVNLSNSFFNNPGPITKPFSKDSVWYNVSRANITAKINNNYEKLEGSIIINFNNGVNYIFDGFRSVDKSFSTALNQIYSPFENLSLQAGYDFRYYLGNGFNPKKTLVDTALFETGGLILINYSPMSFAKILAGIRLNYHQVYKTDLTPHFGLEFSAPTNTKLNLTVSRGFRNPSLAEFFIATAPLYNTDLKPEYLWNYEVSFSQKLLSNHLILNASAFITEINNLIQRTGTAPNFKMENIKTQRNRGFEFEIEAYPFKELIFYSGYSYINMDTKVTGTPKHQLFFDLGYSNRYFSVNTNFKLVKELFNSLSPEIVNNYNLLNMTFAIYPKDDLTIYAKFDNILDKEYEIVYAYPMPGFNYSVGLKIKM